MARYQNQIAVITGAGSGIGEATARRLAQEGAQVVLVGRTESKLRQVAKSIHQDNPEAARIFAADVTQESDVEALAAYVHETYGDLHVLVNNAGGSTQSRILETRVEDWDQVFALNVRSVFLVSKHLGPVMMSSARRQQDRVQATGLPPTNRAIVNVSSLSGHKAGAHIPHYSASKAAVINLTRSLANEYAPHGIRVNSVSPGFIETPLTEQGLQNSRFAEAIQRSTALRRVGQPTEIANVIAFVASAEASYMTGSDVLVDGGWLIV